MNDFHLPSPYIPTDATRRESKFVQWASLTLVDEPDDGVIDKTRREFKATSISFGRPEHNADSTKRSCEGSNTSGNSSALGLASNISLSWPVLRISLLL